MRRGIGMRVAFKSVIGLGLIVSSLASAEMLGSLVDYLRKKPLEINPVRLVEPTALEWACAPMIADVSGIHQKIPPTLRVFSEDDILTVSIQIDKLAARLFRGFPRKAAQMARDIYDEVHVTDDAQCTSVASRFLRIAGQPGLYTPDVRINPQLSRSILYRKIALLQVSLRLVFQRLGEQQTNLFDFWDEGETFEFAEQEWTAEDDLRLARNCQMSSHLLEKMIVEQIPYEYFAADLATVPDVRLRSALLQDVANLRAIPLQGFFLSPQYRISVQNYNEAEAKLLDEWIRETWAKPKS